MKNYSSPCCPPGDSGVTIGIGYDLGQKSESNFTKTWGSLLHKEDI